MDNKKVIAHAWVLGYGYDCDGVESTYIRAFRNENEAVDRAKELINSGDGEGYHSTEKWSEVVAYCESVNKNPENYMYA